MRGVEWNQFKNRVDSLSASTDLRIQVGLVEVTATRQQSPYLSHQKVEFTVVPQLPRPAHVLVANTRYALAVLDYEPEVPQEFLGVQQALRFRQNAGSWAGWGTYLSEGEEPDLVVTRVPASHLGCLISKARQLLGVTIPMLPMWPVAFLRPRLLRFDENGKPVFVEQEGE